MSSNTQVVLQNAICAAASGTYYVDLVTEDWKHIRLITEVTYQHTAATTGVTCQLYGGTGLLDVPPSGGFPYVNRGVSVPALVVGQFPQFGSNSTNVSMAVVPTSQSSATTVRTYFYLNTLLDAWPGLVRVQFTNVDGTNPASINFYADCS